MKILLVNTYDNGGAANSCKRLHYGLLLKGIESKLLLKSKINNWKNSVVFEQRIKKLSFYQKTKNKIVRISKELGLYYIVNLLSTKDNLFLKNRNKNLELFSFPYSDFDITLSDNYINSDIINLHWVANFMDYETFFNKNKKPVVWTLHDMNPFSGGEHYLEEYIGIDELGRPVKRIFSNDELHVARDIITFKKNALAQVANLTIVTPSEWLAKEARKSQVFKDKSIYCIPYGLDSKVFMPRDRRYSRELLNIPIDKKVILFVADSIDNNRKGFTFLKRAFQQLKNSNIVLCAIGNRNKEIGDIENIFELGSISDERLMSIAYSAADVFVIPSLMDNLPNTVIESLMCGTPVIGFPVGGIPEMIKNGVNGFITKDISVNSLIESIECFLDNSSCFNRFSIREDAKKKYDQNVQSQRYIELFKSILNSN